MERFFSTCAFDLLLICLGSVTAWGAGKVWVKASVLIVMTIANTRGVHMVDHLK